MGKAKKRIFNRVSDVNSSVLKREDVIQQIISDIRNSRVTDSTVKHICLFGISIEELSEAGALYEEISAVRHLLC